MRKYPDKKIGPKKLQSIYKKHKIRKKKIKNTKILMIYKDAKSDFKLMK